MKSNAEKTVKNIRSYYSLFSCLDLRKRKVHYELIFLKNAPLFGRIKIDR